MSESLLKFASCIVCSTLMISISFSSTAVSRKSMTKQSRSEQEEIIQITTNQIF
jgi:hypothetical protein